MNARPDTRLTRRQTLATLGAGAAGLLVLACSGGARERPRAAPSTSAPSTVDFAARFAGYEVALEPNGDLANVIWPPFVLSAGPEVRRLYEFQVGHGELMRYMPCFCGCGADGHRNNRDCYIQEVHADGSVTFDAMAPVCDVCLGVTRSVIDMQARGMTPRAMRAAIDAKYAAEIGSSTPTPYPPA